MHLSAELILAYKFQTTVFQAIIHVSARDKNQYIQWDDARSYIEVISDIPDTFGHLRFLAYFIFFRYAPRSLISRETFSEDKLNFLT
jgi:hypothetical protein